MHALIALAFAHALDPLRRAGTAVLAAAGVLLILSLRYFSAFGLGYEVVQLKEMAVYTIGALSAVAALLFNLPRDDDSEAAEAAILARPVSPALVAVGAWLGRLGCLAVLYAVWVAAIYGALYWLKVGQPAIFGYRGATSALVEGNKALLPVLGQFMAAAILLAFAQALARARRPVLLAAGLLALYVVGYAAASLPEPWPRLLPDLARHDLTGVLWGSETGWGWSLLAHGAAWCAVGLALDSGLLRSRLA